MGNLTCGTTYEWQAQLICPNGIIGTTTVSPWSVGGTFTTSACPTSLICGAPTALTANDVTQSSAILHWSAVPGAVAYIVRYMKANSTTTTGFTTVTSSTNVITLTGLAAATYYIWQVQAVCANGTTAGTTSMLSVIGSFKTLAVLVSPNPANQFVGLTFRLEKPTNTLILLRDSYGHEVYSSNTLMPEGTSNFEINTSDLSSGLYIVTIQTDTYRTSSKIIVAH